LSQYACPAPHDTSSSSNYLTLILYAGVPSFIVAVLIAALTWHCACRKRAQTDVPLDDTVMYRTETINQAPLLGNEPDSQSDGHLTSGVVDPPETTTIETDTTVTTQVSQVGSLNA